MTEMAVRLAGPDDAAALDVLLEEMDRFYGAAGRSRPASGCGRSTRRSSLTRLPPTRCWPGTAPGWPAWRRIHSCGPRPGSPARCT